MHASKHCRRATPDSLGRCAVLGESTAKKQYGDQSSRLLFYEGHQSCRVLAVEGGLGRSISGMQIAPFAGVVPPEPERAWQDAPSLQQRTNRLMKRRNNIFRAAKGATQKAKKKDTYEHC
jgi:hypothetical protein